MCLCVACRYTSTCLVCVCVFMTAQKIACVCVCLYDGPEKVGHTHMTEECPLPSIVLRLLFFFIVGFTVGIYH